MSLSFDDNLDPVGYHLHPALRDKADSIQRNYYAMGEHDVLLLRRQLWLFRLVLGKLTDAGVPNAIVENLHPLGDIVADMFPCGDLHLAMDAEDPEFFAAMPCLPDTFKLRLD